MSATDKPEEPGKDPAKEPKDVPAEQGEQTDTSAAQTQPAVSNSDQPDDQAGSESAQPQPPATKRETTQSEAPKTETTKTTSSSAQPTEPKAQQKRPSRWPILLLFLLILGLGAVSAYLYQQQQILQAQLADQGQFESERLNTLTDDLQAVRAQFALARERQQDEQAALNAMGLRVSSLASQVLQITEVNRQSWSLAETEYLLRLANQRLLLEGDADSALGILQAADRMLFELDDPALYSVRGQLAKEIAALKALGDYDRTGLFLELAALIDQSEKLKLYEPGVEPVVAADNITDTNSDSAEASGGPSIWYSLSRLGDFVRINDRAAPIKPLLSPDQHYYLRQNLRFMLEQAQLAVMQQNNEVYQTALTNVQDWVQEYYALNAESTSLLETAASLQQTNINPELPNISASLQMLKTYLRQGEVGPAALQTEPEAAADESPEATEGDSL